MLPPVGNQAIINPTPTPPTSGTMTCYKTQKEYGINLKKISHNVSVEGWLTNDYVHHPSWTTKLYAEEKAELLYRIVGANAGTIDFTNLVFRENSYLRGKYARFVTGDSGKKGVGTLDTFTDTNKNWTDDEWVGYVLIDENRIRYPITDNDATTLTIDGTPEDGEYTISEDGNVQGCMACTKMKISDNTKVVAPVRGGGDGTDQHVDKLLVSLSFKYVDPK